MMIDSASALQLLLDRTPTTVRTESVLLEHSARRVLAQDILADRHYPPFHRSAMDGFAVRFDDLIASRSLSIFATILAGDDPPTSVPPGSAVRIMTGAAVPEDLDTVVKVEESQVTGDHVVLSPAKKIWQNIAKRGEDAEPGDQIVLAGRIIDASVQAAAASCGQDSMRVLAPRIHLITTGNEIVEPGAVPRAVEIRNSNRYTIASLFSYYALHPATVSHVADDPAELKKRLESSLDSELLVLSGGVSAGEADYLPGVMEKCGVEKLFHGVSIRPGKPVWAGFFDSCMVIALPGNPVSTHVTARLFVEPVLRKILGLRREQYPFKRLAKSIAKNHKLQEYLRVTLREDDTLESVPHNGSGDAFASVRATGLAVMPPQSSSIPVGSPVEYIPFLW
ncbi:MAG TPA: molybdopterin molybdotransferase MoeA [Leptospiraceae bacterium]|nr:molybdopterin molybdotransferase MoeA [Leptospirales bacterium]HMX56984.1 molybdopterin molybdotransferase MoeA [Leptospiraceae bacterium]HMY44254.1 molybdopterin molybdotransferase MoeA [Leptospiraceae bacterium]HNE22483.1 molybdopterin molybdotransferase MoeA [Leptospiraceae bacterium]HNJ32812.1 molybdopterin molybdotransferase MoeA [Leptospiraceae bacterium]